MRMVNITAIMPIRFKVDIDDKPWTGCEAQFRREYLFELVDQEIDTTGLPVPITHRITMEDQSEVPADIARLVDPHEQF